MKICIVKTQNISKDSDKQNNNNQENKKEKSNTKSFLEILMAKEKDKNA